MNPNIRLKQVVNQVIVLKRNCGDSNPHVLENISGRPFSLNILLVFETLPSQRKIMFPLFNQSFQHDSMPFLAVFCGFSVIFPLGLVSQHKTAVDLGAEMHQIASSFCKVCIHQWHAFVALDFFVDLMFIQVERWLCRA